MAKRSPEVDAKKRLIKDHKKRMYDMRFFGLEWQEIHQKRWDEDALCGEDTCDCEEIYNKEKNV